MKKPEELKLEEINKAVAILENGGIVIFPTDTVYGIGCKWDNKQALKKLHLIKNSNQNFPVLVSNIEQVEKIAIITDYAKSLINKYWPGGLTIIMQLKNGTDKVGFRMPDSALVKTVIDKLGCAIVGTSANFHGYNTPSDFSQLDEKLKEEVNFVLKGDCKNKKESTVIDVTTNPPKILRQGAIKIL